MLYERDAIFFAFIKVFESWFQEIVVFTLFNQVSISIKT